MKKWPDGNFKTPNDLRQYSLACFSTHDTPTLKGYLSGSDIQWRDRLSSDEGRHSQDAHDQRTRDVSALLAMNGDEATSPDFDSLFDAVHGNLANSEVAMICVQLDDILGQEEAQNLPGTVDEHPNWRRKCPVDLENLPQQPKFDQIGALMRDAGRSLDLASQDDPVIK